MTTTYECVSPILTAIETYYNIVDSIVLNAGFGGGYGLDVETPAFAFSARLSVNLVNFEISNRGIRFYGSIYGGLTYSAEGLTMGPEINIILDYTSWICYFSAKFRPRLADLEYSASAYNEIGGSLSIGFEPKY